MITACRAEFTKESSNSQMVKCNNAHRPHTNLPAPGTTYSHTNSCSPAIATLTTTRLDSSDRHLPGYSSAATSGFAFPLGGDSSSRGLKDGRN